MLKKAYWGPLVSLLFANTAFAGFYLGAGIGPEYAQFTQKSHVFDNFGNFNVIDKESFSGTGVFGNFLGGYSWTHERFSLAAEANFNPSSLRYKLTNDEYLHQSFAKTSFTISYSEGISLLPGFLLTPTANVYGRVGYANGHVKLHNADPSVKSSTADRSGIRYGAGLRYRYAKEWSMMLDYSQTNYSRYRSHSFDAFGGVTKNAYISPTSTQFAFGIIYNFDGSKAA